MRVLLIGFPVDHSLSPTFQNAAFRHAGLDHTYDVLPVRQIEVESVRRLLARPDVLGANVTVPHKTAIVPCLDELTPTASQIGAVNTVYRAADDDIRLMGHNTDGEGLLADLDRLGVGGPFERVAVLGAGGAARAVVVALCQRARRVAIANRTLDKADVLASELGSVLGSAELTSHSLAAAELAFDGAELIVDATALGLGSKPGEAAFQQAMTQLARLPLRHVTPEAVFYDLKYGPESPFTRLGRQLGHRTYDGLGMLIMQGALAFECWTGHSAPVEVMAEAVGLALSSADS